MTLFATELRNAASAAEVSRVLGRVEQEALEHPAIRHAWLLEAARGRCSEHDDPLRRFAHAYHGYVASLPQLFAEAMFRLAPALQEPWQRRLARELGHLGAPEAATLRKVGIPERTVEAIPREALFRRFTAAIGLGDDELAEPVRATLQWRDRLLAYVHEARPAEVFGALAFGTELVEAAAHAPVLRGLLETGSLRREAYVFFELACLPTPEHDHELRAIAAQLAAQPGGLADLHAGMQFALEQRREFLDGLAGT